MSTASPSTLRDNQTWIAELRGEHGTAGQASAHLDLANILYWKAYNYLRLRQQRTRSALVRSYSAEDLAMLAQDFVQNFMLKLAQNHFALLTHYHEAGAFVKWCEKILVNLIADELRHVYWDRERHEDNAEEFPSELTPEGQAQIEAVVAQVKRCLEGLGERRRMAFEHFVLEEKRAKELAPMLETTEGGINQLVRHARHDLQKCLQKHGIGAEVLGLFTRGSY